MLRRLHRLPALIAAVILSIVAVTGAILAIEPPLERYRSSQAEAEEVSIGEVVQRLVARNPSIERITRSPNGTLSVQQRSGGETAIFVADAGSGELHLQQPAGWLEFSRRLHRSLLLGDAGRVGVGVAAAAMLILSLTGILLLVRRLGRWTALLRPIQGTVAARWHCELARAAAPALLLSAVTGCYLSLVTFELLPDPASQAELAAPPGFSNARPRPVPFAQMNALQSVPLSELRELTLPGASAPAVIRLVTSASTTLLDRASGARIVTEPHRFEARVHEWLFSLHTGQGLWPLALVLGLAATVLPVLAGTGTALWWRNRHGRRRIKANVRAHSAETIILVGSEGGATWRHARALHDGLTSAGHKVHTTSMNALARRYGGAERIIVMTSTYGDGTAPASASQFLTRLERLETAAAVAVLGFGDRSFRHYCKFAEDVAAALAAKGLAQLVPFTCIDRQSSREFERWTGHLATCLGDVLAVEVEMDCPRTQSLELIERTTYGEEVQAPTAILRFVPDRTPPRHRWLPGRRTRNSLPRLSPGDLVGILPPGGVTPRFYSIASGDDGNVLEICVRKQPGGVCSTHLHDLQPGETINAFFKKNPAFRPASGRKPLLLIGAGAGIGPLVGVIRENRSKRDIHLYWGGRHPGSDFLYEGDLSYYLSDERLTRMRPVFSRLPNGGYVQDKLAEEANVLRDLVRNGAQIMVCGSTQMAAAVAHTITQIIAPLELDLTTLKARGRYVEDVY